MKKHIIMILESRFVSEKNFMSFSNNSHISFQLDSSPYNQVSAFVGFSPIP